jgi:membrane dipeptidase
MLIIDSHLDIAYNALSWDRDLTQSIRHMRECEAGMPEKGRGLNVVSFDELRRGEIGLFFVTMCCRVASHGKRFPGVRTQDIAYANDRAQLAYYQLMEQKGMLRQIRSAADLTAHLAAWEADPLRCPLGFVLTMEGCDGIVDHEQVPEWWDTGLRVVSLCHYGVSSYSHGTQAPGGLTQRGVPMLQAMEQAGMMLDLSHLAEAAFWEALDAFGGHVLATHNCVRHLCDHDRQFSDDQLKAIIQRQGVVGVAFDDWMLSPLWDKEAQDNTGITLETVVDHMDHINQLAGNAQHCGIGSDLDGGYGKEQSPADMDTIADLQNIPEILARRGYSDDDVCAMMHGNWLRMLRQGLPAS